MRDHSSWAPNGIGMKIEGILKSCFWILLHQGMLSFLCSKIQGYMLSIMNEVDSCVASTVDFVWDAKLVFQQYLSPKKKKSMKYGHGHRPDMTQDMGHVNS